MEFSLLPTIGVFVLGKLMGLAFVTGAVLLR